MTGTSENDGGGTERNYYAKCYDCDAGLSARGMVRREVMMEFEDKSGYEFVPVPLCRRCDLKRNGIPCSECGELYRDELAAYKCCQPLEEQLPDCPECGRVMSDVGSKGFHPGRGESITWTECVTCAVGWGAFSGFVPAVDDETIAKLAGELACAVSPPKIGEDERTKLSRSVAFLSLQIVIENALDDAYRGVYSGE